MCVYEQKRSPEEGRGRDRIKERPTWSQVVFPQGSTDCRNMPGPQVWGSISLRVSENTKKSVWECAWLLKWVNYEVSVSFSRMVRNLFNIEIVAYFVCL